MREEPKARRPVPKAKAMLERYEIPLIVELGTQAFDLLTPHEVAEELGIGKDKIPELLRQEWLAKAPGKDVGNAFQYYRWRVEFVKRYKKRYEKRKDTNLETHSKMAEIGNETT